jgi:quercetin dioxygenase-like cupin family protein
LILTARAAALLLVSGVALAGCAQPGQLGQPAPAPAPPAPAAAPVPPAPAAPAPTEPVTGTLDSRVTIRTPGPAVYSVRTVVLAPGEALGWQRHPGTEMAVVRRGEVTLRRQGDCDPARFTDGQALFVADAVPYRLANTGDEPAELLVTMLLAPGAEESTEVPAACSGS